MNALFADALNVIGSFCVWYGIYLLITGRYGDFKYNGPSTGRKLGLFMVLTIFLGISMIANIVRVVFFLAVLISSVQSQRSNQQTIDHDSQIQ